MHRYCGDVAEEGLVQGVEVDPWDLEWRVVNEEVEAKPGWHEAAHLDTRLFLHAGKLSDSELVDIL